MIMIAMTDEVSESDASTADTNTTTASSANTTGSITAAPYV